MTLDSDSTDRTTRRTVLYGPDRLTAIVLEVVDGALKYEAGSVNTYMCHLPRAQQAHKDADI